MNPQSRYLPLEPIGDEPAHRAEAASLNRRIALVATVVMAELGALTAALDAWAEGHMSMLVWILGFQLVSFLLALNISMATPEALWPNPVVGVGSAEPAAAD